jgi:hypothetical protein
VTTQAPSKEWVAEPVAPELLFPKPPGRAPNCVTCGRFLYWNFGGGYWQCRKISYDSYAGGWEHD